VAFLCDLLRGNQGQINKYFSYWQEFLKIWRIKILLKQSNPVFGLSVLFGVVKFMINKFLQVVLVVLLIIFLSFAGTIGKLYGSVLILPAICIFFSYYAFKYLTKGKLNYITYSIIIQFAHMLWMVVSVVILYLSSYVNLLNSLYLDLIIIMIGLFWLYFRIGIGPIIYMTIYQCFSILMNIMALHGQTAALTIHTSLRVASILLMLYGYAKFKKTNKSLGMTKS